MIRLKHFTKRIFKGRMIPPLVIIEFPYRVEKETLDEIKKMIEKRKDFEK